MIYEKTGDALESGADIIAHQVNCMQIMGGGIAAQIKKKWPEVNREYVRFCVETIASSGIDSLMGRCQLVEYKPGAFVANLFGQFQCSSKIRMTNYEALYTALSTLKYLAWELAEKLDREVVIAIPKYIGCGLGGGSWGVVSAILDDLFADDKMLRLEIIEWAQS